MNRRVGRAYFLIPVVYIGVIFLLFFLQYYGDELFRSSISDLSVRGRLNQNTATEQDIEQVEISYNGLIFAFQEGEGLIITTSDGAEQVLSLRSYDTRDDGFDLFFAEGAQVSFSLVTDGTDSESEELYVQPVLPDELLPIEQLSIPYQISGEAVGGSESVQQNLTIEFEAATYYLTLPPRSEIRTSERRIVVPGDLTRQTIRYTRLIGDPQDIVSIWFADDSLAISTEEMLAQISGYVDSAYSGWRQRYNSGSGTWEMKSGSAEFNESIAVAYLAEAWQRGDFTRAFNEMRRAADLHPEDIGLPSAVYLGNLREIRARFLAEDQARDEELVNAVRRRDATVFRNIDLVEFAVHRGSEVLLNELLAFAPLVDFRDVDMLTAVGMFAAYSTAGQISEELARSFTRLRAVAEERILPALLKADEGFFLETGQNQVDVWYSLYAGVLLAGIETDDPRLRTIGRNLMASVLNLAEDAGFLPSVLLVSNGAIQQTQGRLGPEDIYETLTPRDAYPRTVSLYPELGHGAWVRTAVPLTEISISDASYQFEIDNTPNRTHYMIFQGIPAFTSMQLFGLAWRNAPDFEIYSKGRHYNPETETLMVKYYDDDTNGVIILDY